MTTLIPSQPLTLRQRVIKFWRRFPVYLYRLGLGRALGGLPLLILTTRKTTTGGPRYTPLEYRRHGSRIYVISPQPETARWYAHALEQPFAVIRMGGRSHTVRVTVVSDEAEAVRALFLFRLTQPVPLRWITWSARQQDEIKPQALKKTARRYAVVRLEIVSDAMEGLHSPVPADRVWAWGVVGAVVVVLALISRRER